MAIKRCTRVFEDLIDCKRLLREVSPSPSPLISRGRIATVLVPSWWDSADCVETCMHSFLVCDDFIARPPALTLFVHACRIAAIVEVFHTSVRTIGSRTNVTRPYLYVTADDGRCDPVRCLQSGRESPALHPSSSSNTAWFRPHSLAEVAILSQLDHPTVVRLHDFFIPEPYGKFDELYMVPGARARAPLRKIPQS